MALVREGMSKTTTITYPIIADEETHNRLIRFFKTAHILGVWGCSRNLRMPFDGDGPAVLSIPGLSDVPFDKPAMERETDTSDGVVNVLACVPGRGAIKAFLGDQGCGAEWAPPEPREHLALTLEVGRAIPLAEVNERLEALGVLLVVGHWDGKGDREPTTLEVMSTEEHARRCEVARLERLADD